jgi:hypothetical protein
MHWRGLKFFIVLAWTAGILGSPAAQEAPGPPDPYPSGREEWVLLRGPADAMTGCLEAEESLPEAVRTALDVLACSTPDFCAFIRRSLQEKGVFPDLGVRAVSSRWVSGSSVYYLFLKAPPGAQPIPVPLRLTWKAVASALADVQTRLRDHPNGRAYILLRVSLGADGRPEAVESIHADEVLAPVVDVLRTGLAVDWRGQARRPLVLFVLAAVSAEGSVLPNWIGYAPAVEMGKPLPDVQDISPP